MYLVPLPLLLFSESFARKRNLKKEEGDGTGELQIDKGVLCVLQVEEILK